MEIRRAVVQGLFSSLPVSALWPTQGWMPPRCALLITWEGFDFLHVLICESWGLEASFPLSLDGVLDSARPSCPSRAESNMRCSCLSTVVSSGQRNMRFLQDRRSSPSQNPCTNSEEITPCYFQEEVYCLLWRITQLESLFCETYCLCALSYWNKASLKLQTDLLVERPIAVRCEWMSD